MNVIKYNVNSGDVCQIGRQYEYGKSQVVFEGYQITDSANEIYFKFVGRTEDSKYLIPIIDMTLDITQQLTKHVGQFSCQLEEMNTEGTLVSQSPVFYVAVKRSIKVGADYEVQDPRLETIYQKYNEMYNIISQTNETSLANESQRQAEWLTLKQEVSDAINSFDADIAIGEFRTLVQTETDNFNTNATEKLNAYNSNADNRLSEFNTHTEQIQTDISELKSDLGELKSDLNKKVGDTTVFSPSISFEICFYTNVDGVASKFTSSTAWKSALIDVSEFAGKEITVTTYHDKFKPCFAVDSELHILDTYSTTSGNSSIPRTYTIPITNETKYIIVQTYNDDNLIPTIEGLDVDLTTVVCKAENRIDEVENGLENAKGILEEVENDVKNKIIAFDDIVVSNNHLNLAECKLSTNFDGTGAEITSSSYGCTNVIKILDDVTEVSAQTNDGDFAVINRVIVWDSSGNIIDYVGGLGGAKYNLPSGADTIRFSLVNSFFEESIYPHIVFTSEHLPYDEYTAGKINNDVYLKKDNVIGIRNIENSIDIANRKIENSKWIFNTIDSSCDDYTCNAESVTISHTSVDDLYTLYDGLVSKYPEYVSKTLLGKISDDLPIYRYDFIPALPIDSKRSDCPRIIYTSGTHGGEYPSMVAGYVFFKELCENWKNYKLLRDLRMCVHFIAIPIVNPYGFINATRKNENGVDLNRNFTKGWNGIITDPTNNNYPGAYAGSEISTQLIESLCSSEEHIFGIDHHIFGAFTASGKFGYTVASEERPEDCAFADMFGTWANGKFFKDQNIYTDMSNNYYQTIEGTRFGGYLYGAFMNGFLIEVMTHWGNADMEAEKSSQNFNVEMIATIMYTAYKNYFNHVDRLLN